MRKYIKIVKTTIHEEDGHEQEQVIETLHTLKTWDELSDEEKEKEIESRSEAIYNDYQDMLYQEFKDELDIIREDFKEITFDDIYFDTSSHGSWIDGVKNFKLNASIKVFDDDLWVDEVDLHFSKYISEDFEIYIDEYYINDEKLDKIKNTKKYQNWLKKQRTLVSKWIQRVNEITKYMLDREYSYPYNIHNDEEKEWLEGYFEDMEFEFVETLREDSIC